MQHIIKDFLKNHQITAVEFCKDMGISVTHLQLLYHRKRYPSRELCQRIYEYTAGEIHPMDLLEIKEKKKGKQKANTQIPLEDNRAESVT